MVSPRLYFFWVFNLLTLTRLQDFLHKLHHFFCIPLLLSLLRAAHSALSVDITPIRVLLFLLAFSYSCHRSLLSLHCSSTNCAYGRYLFMATSEHFWSLPPILFKLQVFMTHSACCCAWQQQHQTVSCCNTLGTKTHGYCTQRMQTLKETP